jgi:hypothetical protein
MIGAVQKLRRNRPISNRAPQVKIDSPARRQNLCFAKIRTDALRDYCG